MYYGSKTALETASDRIESPVSVMLVDLPYDNSCLDREILTKIIMNDLSSRGLIYDPDKGIGYLPEILTSSVRIVNGDRKGNALNVGREFSQIYFDLLIISFAGTGEVISLMNDCSARMSQIAVEDKFFLCRTLSVRSQKKCARIQVEIRSRIELIDIPSETYHDPGKARVLLGKADFLTFTQINRHTCILLY